MFILTLLSTYLACSSNPQKDNPKDTSSPKDSATPHPDAKHCRAAGIVLHSARWPYRASPPHQVDALEALLYGQDDLEAGDWSSAQQRVNAIFRSHAALRQHLDHGPGLRWDQHWHPSGLLWPQNARANSSP